MKKLFWKQKLNLLNKKGQAEDIGSDLFPALIIFFIALIIIAGMRFNINSNIEQTYNAEMNDLNYIFTLNSIKGNISGKLHENLRILADLNAIKNLDQSDWDKSMFYERDRDLPFICKPGGKLENYFKNKLNKNNWYVVVFDSDTKTSFFHCSSQNLVQDLSGSPKFGYGSIFGDDNEERMQPYMPDKGFPLMTLEKIPELDLNYNYDKTYWGKKGWSYFIIHVPKKDSSDYLIYKFALGDK